jgi:peroxiredoxin
MNGLTIALVVGISWTFVSRISSTESQAATQGPSPKEGFPAPDFSLDLLGGGRVALSELRGRPVLVNFWATWCPPCRQEMPAIEKVHRDYEDLGLVVVGVNLTDQDSLSAVTGFVQELGITFPIALDRDGAVSRQYHLLGLPSTFFIDPSGVIRSVVVGGPMSEALIRSKVDDLLKGAQ